MKNLDGKYINNSLLFISNHRKQLDHHFNEFFNSLYVESPKKYFKVVRYSDIENTWLIEKYENLKILTQKCKHMVYVLGQPNDVLPLLKSIASNKLKKLTQPNKHGSGEFLGYGHFRWNYKAIILSKKELEILNNVLWQK